MICLLDPQEDEILYSVIARTMDSLAGVSQAQFRYFLYGFKQLSPSIHLPINLNGFISRIQPWSNLTALQIINNHTLYPYYAAFASESRREDAIEKMKSGGENPMIGGIGLYLRGTEAKRFLCICSLCVEQDRLRYGEAHYRRQHQVPTTWMCSKHELPLLETQVPMRNFVTRDSDQKIVSLEKSLERVTLPKWTSKLETNQFAALTKIAKASEWILNNLPIAKDGTWFKEQYQFYIKSRGYINNKSQFLVDKIEIELEEMFSAEALKVMGFKLGVRTVNSWYLPISGRPEVEKGYPTLHHLVLITFLGLTPNVFINEKRFLSLSAVQFGPPPYPCANKFCPYYLQKIIFERPKTSSFRKTHTFTCLHCGYAYKLAPNSSLEKAKAAIYGHVWDDKLRRVASDMKISRSEASRLLGIGDQTLRFAARRLSISQWMAISDRNLPSNKVLREYHSLLSMRALKSNRERFSSFLDLHPDYTRSQIREHIESTVMYLIRNDRDWYEKHAPAVMGRWQRPIKKKS